MERLNFDLMSLIMFALDGDCEELRRVSLVCHHMNRCVYRFVLHRLVSYGSFRSPGHMLEHMERLEATSGSRSVSWRAQADALVLLEGRESLWLHLLQRWGVTVEQRSLVRYLWREVAVQRRFHRHAHKEPLSAAHLYLIARWPLCFYSRDFLSVGSKCPRPGVRILPVAEVYDRPLVIVSVERHYGEYIRLRTARFKKGADLESFPAFWSSLVSVERNVCVNLGAPSYLGCSHLGPYGHSSSLCVELYLRRRGEIEARSIFGAPHPVFPAAHLWQALFTEVIRFLPPSGATEWLDSRRCCGEASRRGGASHWVQQNLGVAVDIERLGNLRVAHLSRAGVPRSARRHMMHQVAQEVRARKWRHSPSLFLALQRFVAARFGYPESPVSVARMNYEFEFHWKRLVETIRDCAAAKP